MASSKTLVNEIETKWLSALSIAERKYGIDQYRVFLFQSYSNRGAETQLDSSKKNNQTEQLVELAGQGDKLALNELFQIHRAYLRRVIDLRLEDELRSRVDPSDVIQETQLEAAKRIDEYLSDRKVPFRIWLRRTAIEQLINLRRHHIKAEKRSLHREVRLTDHSAMTLATNLMRGTASQIVQREELSKNIRNVIATMNERDREMLVLRHIEELTNQEVAALLEIDSSTASQRYGRALRRLRDKLKESGITDMG